MNEFNLVDYSMHCCGIVQADGFSSRSGNPARDNMERTKDKTRFQLIEEHQKKHRRNCAIIALAEYQRVSIESALANGFAKVFEFHNPNSGYRVGIYAKALWGSAKEYTNAVDSGEYKTPGTDAWRYKVNDVLVLINNEGEVVIPPVEEENAV